MPKKVAPSEDSVVRALRKLFRGAQARRVATVGIGDDAAVLRAVESGLVWTVDTSVEGVHFRREWLSLSEIGRRAFHAAASDLAAMGATPLAALSSVIVPAAGSGVATEIAKGQARAAKELGCPVVGGNLSRGRELSVTTTVLGTAERPISRGGAVPGDELWLIGDVGLAAAGLRCLERPRRRRGAAMKSAIAAFRSPRARIAEGRRLVGRAHAAIDVSDGLARDARHLADESRVRVLVFEGALVRVLPRALFSVAEQLGSHAVELALNGGEDYALLAAGPASKRPPFARVIGAIEKGHGALLVTVSGRRLPLSGGFDHFR